MKITLFLFLMVLFTFSDESYSMNAGNNIEIGVSYSEAELTNDETSQNFNYGGFTGTASFNFLLTSGKRWHSYLGVGGEYSTRDNNANNSVQTEESKVMGPGIEYRLHYQRAFLGLSYNYLMAEQTGSGSNISNLDFEIHRAGIRVGLDHKISDNFYISGSYRYGYGITSGLADDHVYNDHTFGFNLVFQFGATEKTETGDSNRRKTRSKGKRSKLFNFFNVN